MLKVMEKGKEIGACYFVFSFVFFVSSNKICDIKLPSESE